MELKNFLYLIYIKARLNIKAENSHNKLSNTSLIIEPVLFMGIYYVVFAVLLNAQTDDFLIYLLTGLVPWLWFNKSITRSSMSIVAGKAIASQVAISKSFFVLVTCTQETMRQGIAISLLLIAVIVFGFAPNNNWFWLPAVILIQYLFTTATALILAHLVTFIRDINLLVSSATRVLMYLSGVIYPISKVPENYKWLFDINPIANMIKLYRDILIYQTPPSLYSIAYVSGISVLILLISYLLYSKTDETLTREIMR